MAHLEGEERARYVRRMFARICRRYDRLNTVMTAGRHHAWRRMATNAAVDGLEGPALDVATGTGDFALDLALRTNISHVAGLDNTPEMLCEARRKANRYGLARRITFSLGDAHALPFGDNRFVCATVGFGIRNFTDVPLALREMARVVRPGGRVVTLEIVKLEGGNPLNGPLAFYFRHVTPWLGALLARDREAYTYLPESVLWFHGAQRLASMFEEAGLRNVTYRKLALGSVAILVGEKS